MENKIKPLLPQISIQKHGIITTLVSGFIGLAYEGISSFLQQKCENALQKAVHAMSNQATIQHNRLMKLDDTMLMYGIYNAETLEKLINTVQELYNVTSSHGNYLQGNTTLHFLDYYTRMPWAYNNMHSTHCYFKDYSGQVHFIIQGINHPIAIICLSY